MLFPIVLLHHLWTFILLPQVKKDIIRTKGVSILRDDSETMNENFPVGEKKKKLWETQYLNGPCKDKQGNERKDLFFFCMVTKWETCGILLHLNIRQCHIFMFTCQIPRALKYGHLNSSWFGFQWELQELQVLSTAENTTTFIHASKFFSNSQNFSLNFLPLIHGSIWDLIFSTHLLCSK